MPLCLPPGLGRGAPLMPSGLGPAAPRYGSPVDFPASAPMREMQVPSRFRDDQERRPSPRNLPRPVSRGPMDRGWPQQPPSRGASSYPSPYSAPRPAMSQAPPPWHQPQTGCKTPSFIQLRLLVRTPRQTLTDYQRRGLPAWSLEIPFARLGPRPNSYSWGPSPP